MRSGNLITDLIRASEQSEHDNFDDFEFNIYSIFMQTWGSTAMGFGGVGGQALTSAHTIIVRSPSGMEVYFAGRFAYRLLSVNDEFYEDVTAQTMEPVGRAGKYGELSGAA